jgi:hypothetical protein
VAPIWLSLSTAPTPDKCKTMTTRKRRTSHVEGAIAD